MIAVDELPVPGHPGSLGCRGGVLAAGRHLGQEDGEQHGSGVHDRVRAERDQRGYREQQRRERSGQQVLHDLFSGFDPGVRARQVRLADDAGNHRADRAVVHRLERPVDEDDDVQPPDRQLTGGGEQHEQPGEHRAHAIGHSQGGTAVDAVDQDARRDREEQPRQHRERGDPGDEQRVIGEPNGEQRDRGAGDAVAQAAGQVGREEVRERAASPCAVLRMRSRRASSSNPTRTFHDISRIARNTIYRVLG